MKLLLNSILLFFFSSVTYGQKDANAQFELSKGKWPIPISKYIKIEDNEKRKHLTTNLFDSTLRIVTDSSRNVICVHDATVFKILEAENEYAVLTKFGDYYISYNRLSKPELQEGEKVIVGQIIGKVTKNWTEENYTLELMLIRGTDQLNPKRWIHW